MGSFLSNFGKILRVNVDHNLGDSSCLGFQNALERSLRQVGMGGKEGLYQYWKTSVQRHVELLDIEADEYRNAYSRKTVCD